MLHASCFSSCYFLSFRGQHGQGEAQGDAEHGREAAQPWHNAQGTQQLPGAGNHLLKETSEIFVSPGWCLWGVSHWAAKLAPAAWLWAAHPQHLCRSWGVEAVQQLLLLIPAALLFYF